MTSFKNTNQIIIIWVFSLCVVEYRQKGRFAGFSIYVSNNGDIEGSNMCYRDGSKLPPLNFTTTCTENGRYVIFYNERKEGVDYPDGYQVSTLYTELCEVIVRGKHVMYHIICHFTAVIIHNLNTYGFIIFS